jgi:predicted nuclease with TOPRIM domain
MNRVTITLMDIKQTMQFILDTQARLEATASQHDERLTKLETSVSTVTDLVGRLAQAEIRLIERMDRLAESQAHTDQRLDILIDVVDKLVPRNGSPR